MLELERIFVALNFKYGKEDDSAGDNGKSMRQPITFQSEKHAQSQSAIDLEDEDMLDIGRDIMLGTDTHLLFPSGEPLLAPLMQPRGPIPQTTKLTPSTPHPINIPAASDLFDAAFRSLICSKPAKLPLGIWLPKPALDMSLSTLVPSLLQPGYAKVSFRYCT